MDIQATAFFLRSIAVSIFIIDICLGIALRNVIIFSGEGWLIEKGVVIVQVDDVDVGYIASLFLFHFVLAFYLFH